ncbi:hypothetical protein PLANPX_3134 [Lacipirellula parvula]|uniref:DUF6690 domain-containing protein n=2 Tax=Lacipirellula parvula TaxID=2650471 RepID=A0A5K7XC49_9BACT|nr:DUF6690 family protein [Lacipirellula parvula]BBO33522.1 hypothetical protein PLANPX_3134 [Lacipirellula parvula]
MPALLAASVAVPYIATNAPEWAEQIRQPAAAAPATPAPAAPAHNAAAAAAPAGGATPAATAAPASPFAHATTPLLPASTPRTSAMTYALPEILRFDVTKEWVYQRWDRKSTALADLDLFGVRVPLVSGTQVYDIAGSLTYFFGADGRVKRISFRGWTGDTTQLAMLLHQRFGLQAVPTVIAGQQLLQVRQGDDVISELRTQVAPVLNTSNLHDSFTVEFELQDPATAKPLKPQVASVSTPPPAAPGTSTVPADPKAATAANPAAEEAKPTETASAEKKEEPAAEKKSMWESFRPRSRATEGQLNQLNRNGIY